MDQLRAQAIEMIRGQHRVNRLTKRCKLMMLLLVAGSFMVGLLIGMSVPYDIRITPSNGLALKPD